MKKFEKSAELLWLFGIIFVALGVAICSKADLGVSMIAAPAFGAVIPMRASVSGAAVHFAYSVVSAVTGVEKSYACVQASSLYQPPNV